MTLRHYWNRETGETYWFSLETGEIDGCPGKFHYKPERRKPASPMIMTRAADKTAFKSPINREVIDSHWKRNEHMKRHNVREVDTSEHKPCYRNPEFRKKYNIPDSKAGAPLERIERVDVPIPESISKALYEKLAKS